MHVFVAGLSRSGSTLLANLMTSPPLRWLLVEPGITRGEMGEHVRRQAQHFGIPVEAADWVAGPDETALDRFARLLAPHLGKLQRWGVKEVNPGGWDELIERFDPGHVVLMVRDLRDAAISIMAKEARASGPKKSQTWMFNHMHRAARELVRLYSILPPERVIIVRYEDFVGSAEERRRIGDRLAWPLDGDPMQRLDMYNREFEIELHAGQVTTLSVGRAARTASPEQRAFEERLLEENEEFVRTFGYG